MKNDRTRKAERPSSGSRPAKTPSFVRPTLQRRGALNRITTAFGGTFTP